MLGSWAVSFGMPSQTPDVWRTDVAETRRRLPRGKLLSVSVVGTVQPGWTVDDLARDYARCARWAVESGADTVETNFSCPNVSTCDGQLFQNVSAAAAVVQAVREAIGRTPYIVKIGHLVDVPLATDLLRALSPHVTALAMTNSVATQVIDEAGQPLFSGERRGICGDATRDASLEQTRLFSRLIAENGLPITTIGVGGVRTAEHVRQYLAAGAHAAHLATAAMTDPRVGLEIRRELEFPQ
jgi:dihydroorotate dehydrogenase